MSRCCDLLTPEQSIGSPIECASAGVTVDVTPWSVGARHWNATLIIPFAIVPGHAPHRRLFGNVFRIDYYDETTREYQAYNPTGGPVPCFHKPGYFVEFVLVQ